MAFGPEMIQGADVATKSGKGVGSVAKINKIEGCVGSAVKGVKASTEVEKAAEIAEVAAKLGKVVEKAGTIQAASCKFPDKKELAKRFIL